MNSFTKTEKAVAKCLQKLEVLNRELRRQQPKRKRPQKGYTSYPARDEQGKMIVHSPKKRKKATGHLLKPASTTENQDFGQFGDENIEPVQRLKEKISEVMMDLEIDSVNQTSPWERRKERESQNWEQCRPSFFDAYIRRFSPLNNISMECSECDQHAVIRCTQCRKVLCQNCDDVQHKFNGLHDRETIVGNHWAYIQPLQGKLVNAGTTMDVEHYLPVFPGACPCGEADSIEQMKVTRHLRVIAITELGRYDVLLPFVSCPFCNRDLSPQIEDIITCGFWPGSARMHDGMYIFTEEVFSLFDFLKLEKAGLSVKAFVTSLQFMSSTRGRNSIISQKIFSECFREWRRCKFELENLCQKNDMSCPACADDMHACHIDGNRKLYRFKNRAVSNEDNYYKDVFIIDDDKVDEMVKKIQGTGVQEKSGNCGESHWKAAKSCSKTMKNLEETGLVVGCCKHAIMLKALNMFQGEIFAYPMILQWSLLQDFHSIKFICQDVVCKYFPWMLKVLDKAISLPGIEQLKECNPFLSVMHGKAHDWSCQIIYGGRWQDGSGIVTGEEMEQCNSYISTAGLTTKNMSKTENKPMNVTLHTVPLGTCRS